METPTIDQQIEWLTKQLQERELGPVQDIFIAIKENLLAIKNHTYQNWKERLNKIDFEKVILDLLNIVHNESSNEVFKNAVQNAEAAIGMINAFKQKRAAQSEFNVDLLEKRKKELDQLSKGMSESYFDEQL